MKANSPETASGPSFWPALYSLYVHPVTAARLLREAKAAKAQERKTKLAVNKAAKAAAAGHGRPVEGNTTL